MVLPVMIPEAEVMIAVPAEMAVTTPLALTVATVVFDELQVTCEVLS